MAEPPTRPSRLLNLNKSSKAQKEITARNASESSFLRLPPELRCRIYDHLFASTAIHIHSKHQCDNSPTVKHYRLTICHNVREHVEIPRRYVEHSDFDAEIEGRGCTVHDPFKTPVTSSSIGLGLLQTSRQIYHEAVLKPFSESRFYYNARMSSDVCGLRNFVDALAPPQAKAITRLRLIIEHAYVHKRSQILPSLAFGVIPGKGTITKLTGLKDLEIVLGPVFFETRDARRYLADISMDVKWLPSMQSLVELRLRTLRITIEAEFVGEDDEYVTLPTFSSRGETGEIEEWLKGVELDLHVGKMVAIGQKPWPSFAIKQDDDAIRIPPWSTDEALEKIRVEKEKRSEQYRLEDQAFAAAQQRLVNAGHPQAWSIDELSELAETTRRETRERIGALEEAPVVEEPAASGNALTSL